MSFRTPYVFINIYLVKYMVDEGSVIDWLWFLCLSVRRRMASCRKKSSLLKAITGLFHQHSSIRWATGALASASSSTTRTLMKRRVSLHLHVILCWTINFDLLHFVVHWGNNIKQCFVISDSTDFFFIMSFYQIHYWQVVKKNPSSFIYFFHLHWYIYFLNKNIILITKNLLKLESLCGINKICCSHI